MFSVLRISSFLFPPRSAMRRGTWKCNTAPLCRSGPSQLFISAWVIPLREIYPSCALLCASYMNFISTKAKSMSSMSLNTLRRAIQEKNAAAEAKMAPHASHQQVPNTDGSITSLHKSKREGTAPPNELTADDKLNILIKS